MKIIKLLLFLIIAILSVAFSISNYSIIGVSLNPLPWQINMPVYGLIFIGVFIGLLINLISVWKTKIKYKKVIKNLIKQQKIKNLNILNNNNFNNSRKDIVRSSEK